MKCKIPEISWHNRDPVLSVDIQPKVSTTGNSLCRLASSGTDAHVLIWFINRADDGSDIELELAADLSRHQRAVNTVRWSPNGQLLASGDDESIVFIWKQKGENEILNVLDDTNEQDKEVWVTLKVLRGHTEDIYDLSWSPNSQFLVTGSVDNTAMMWDVQKGKSLAILDDHKGYVQGVAWDPKNQYIATMSTDRHLRVFDIHTKKVLHRISKSTLPVPEGHKMYSQNIRLYHDGTLQTFFRRLSFTPDGKLLLTPSGVTDYDGVTKPLNTTYGFNRYDMRQPAFVLPCPDQYTVAVRCSPILYQLRAHDVDKNPPVISLPYRMIFAVATKSSVYFYDTQQKQPFAVISNIHYTRLTDLTWSSDGSVVIVSSTDGFCSLITFNEGELGTKYEDSDAVLNAAMISEITPKKGKKLKRQKFRKLSTDEIAPLKPLNESLNDVLDDNCHNLNQIHENLNDSKENEIVTDANQSDDKTEEAICTNEKVPKTIAFRRKEVTSPNKVVDCNKSKSIVSVLEKPDQKLTIATDVIIDKEILSTDERFESPEKKSRPVTPIMVRRYPRTPSSTTTPTGQSTKRATPIAVRRTPRVLIAEPVNASPVSEEALDAWPLDEGGIRPSITSESVLNELNKDSKNAKSTEATLSSEPLAIIEATSDRTEDIRLVYEDTQEENHSCKSANIVTETKINETKDAASPKRKPQAQPDTNSKTPRRVALKTISTPKSKKTS